MENPTKDGQIEENPIQMDDWFRAQVQETSKYQLLDYDNHCVTVLDGWCSVNWF